MGVFVAAGLVGGGLLVSLLALLREFSELGSFFKMPVNSYSSGMRARLAFGCQHGDRL